jgi:hypothetical protein
MYFLRNSICTVLVLMTLACGFSVSAEDKHDVRKEGPYLMIEGNVTQINARMLVIDGQQYPISKFARVFNGSEKGMEMSVQTLSQVGKIEKARLYILGGRVEKIIVILNLS